MDLPPSYFAHDFGHPARPPFDGEKLIGCKGTTSEFETGYISLGCDMNQGSSGGGWLRGTNRAGWGYLNGVNSFLLRSRPGYLYSPYYGEAVRSLLLFRDRSLTAGRLDPATRRSPLMLAPFTATIPAGLNTSSRESMATLGEGRFRRARQAGAGRRW